MAKTRGPTVDALKAATRRSSRLATKEVTQAAPKPLYTARGNPSTRGGRHAHAIRQKSPLNCPPSPISPSASYPSRSSLSTPRCLPPAHNISCDKPSSSAAMTSPVATAIKPLPQHVSSRPAFLLPSPPLSPLLPPPFKSSLLLRLILTLVVLLLVSPQ